MAVAVAPPVVTPRVPSPAPRTVAPSTIASPQQSAAGVAHYPGRPAAGSAELPAGPLRRTLLRMALGSSRTGTPAVQLRGAAAAKAAETLVLEFHVAAATAGPAAVADEDGGAVVAVRPPVNGVHDEWVDLLGGSLTDFDMTVQVVGPGGARLGGAAVLGCELRDRKGVLQRPLTSPTTGRLVGTLTLDFVVVTPLAVGAAGGAAGAAAGSLPPSRPPTAPVATAGATPTAPPPSTALAAGAPVPPRFAGHRGVGKRGTSWVQENTLLSFLSATRGPHVSAVELDVQLTRDGHPVIYHDFFVKRVGVDVDVPIYSLTLEQWRKLAPSLMESSGAGHPPTTRPASGAGGAERAGGGGSGSNIHGNRSYSSDDVDAGKGGAGQSPVYPPFRSDGVLHDELPTLKRICRKVPADVGFLVELKVPPPHLLAARSLPYPERNALVDATLARVFCETNNAGRPISFLSFDADVVLMLRLKQDRYPVYYLNSEVREVLNDKTDPRTTTFAGGLAWAVAARVHGMVLTADMVLEAEGAARVAAVKAAGLTLMTYGVANMTPANAVRQMELGVDGVIADNVAVVAAEVVRHATAAGPPAAAAAPAVAPTPGAPPSPSLHRASGGVSEEEAPPAPRRRHRGSSSDGSGGVGAATAAAAGGSGRIRNGTGGALASRVGGTGAGGGGRAPSSASSVVSNTESVASLVSSLDEDDDDDIHLPLRMETVSEAPPLGLTRLF